MKTPYRILLAATGATLVFLLGISLTGIEGLDSIFTLLLSIVTFFSICFSIKTPREVQRAKDAVPVKEYHENGEVKLNGQTIHGKREDRWTYYNENGKLLKTEVYNDGHLMRTIEN